MSVVESTVQKGSSLKSIREAFVDGVVYSKNHITNKAFTQEEIISEIQSTTKQNNNLQKIAFGFQLLSGLRKIYKPKRIGTKLDKESKTECMEKIEEELELYRTVNDTAFSLGVGVREGWITRFKIFRILCALIAGVINPKLNCDNLKSAINKKIKLITVPSEQNTTPEQFNKMANDECWYLQFDIDIQKKAHLWLNYLSEYCECYNFSQISYDTDQEIYKEAVLTLFDSDKIKSGSSCYHVLKSKMRPSELKTYLKNKENHKSLKYQMEAFQPKVNFKSEKHNDNHVVTFCQLKSLHKNAKLTKIEGEDICVYKSNGMVIDVYGVEGRWVQRLAKAIDLNKLTVALKNATLENLKTIPGYFYYEETDGSMHWLLNKTNKYGSTPSALVFENVDVYKSSN